MAVLQDGLFSLSIEVTEVAGHSDHGFEVYRARLTWDGQPILNPAITKQNSRWGDWVSVHAELKDSLVEQLMEWSELREGGVWQSTEPDLAIRLQTGRPLFAASASQPAVVDDHEVQATQAMLSMDLPGDWVELIVAIDRLYLDGIDAYAGFGPAFRMRVGWNELADFAADLAKEREAVLKLEGASDSDGSPP